MVTAQLGQMVTSESARAGSRNNHYAGPLLSAGRRAASLSGTAALVL
jgi:hypothetical protein